MPRTNLEGMANGYEKSDRGDGSPRLPDIKGGVKGFRVPSGNLNNSDVIFRPEDLVKENSDHKMNLNE